MSTSAVNSRVSLSSNLVMSISGWASGSSSLACSASTYSFGSASLIASSSTAPRPTWRSMTIGGHLAAAEAGHVDLLGDLLVRRVEARLELLEGHLDGELGPGRAQSLDGALHRWFSSVIGSAGGWRSCRRAPGSVGRSRVVRRAWSGRQDSNLRSPAPKAGALATTLRPGVPAPAGTPGSLRGRRRPRRNRESARDRRATAAPIGDGVRCLWHHGAAPAGLDSRAERTRM